MFPTLFIKVISGIGLGIPQTQSIRPSPPPFTKPVVHSAPSISLVNYDRDDDDDMMDNSMEQGVCVCTCTVIHCVILCVSI